MPPEYRRLGCLPPEPFVPQLMEHLGERTYVALLSAAGLHGAAHQRPQGFQVMVERNRRSIECGAVRVQFVARRDLASTAVVAKNTPRGALVVAAREATALELVGTAVRCGGLGNVVTVLLELALEIEPEKPLLAARSCPIAWTQRLASLLERIEQGALAAVLESLVAESARVVARFLPSVPAAGAERDARWRLVLNATVEPDG